MPGNPTSLNAKQEYFCRLYTQNSELFGNATMCYAEAYGFDLDSLSRERPCDLEPDHEHMPSCPPSQYTVAYQTCSSNGSRSLRNAKIQRRITELLNEFMRDDVVDAQLVKTILQDHKLDAKVAAIREYNKLRQRIVEKVDHTSKGKEIVGLPVAITIVAPDAANPDVQAES